MKLPIEELLGKEIKRVILETFQEFLLSKNNEKSDCDEILESELKEQKITIDNELTLKKKTKESNKKDIETVNVTTNKNKNNSKKEKIISKAESKTTGKKINKSGTQDTGKPSTPSKCVPSAKSLQIEKLKSYVFKCGVRKVW